MPNQNKSKKSLSIETHDLRKQVQDLRQAAHERHRVEAALRASEALYRATVEAAAAALFRLGPDGGLLFVNQECLEQLGYADRQAFELSALAPSLFAEPADGRGVYASAAAGETEIKVRLKLRDGSAVPALLRARRGADLSTGVTLTVLLSR